MNHTKTLTALSLCAVLLLSGCNADKPAETSAATEEVTTTTTAETTFAENTTASASTTTAAECPENTGKIYMDFDEASLSFDDKAFEIFESVFYGTWTSTWLNGMGEHSETTLTYSESEFDFLQGVYPYGITETDEFYVMPVAGGGMMGCYLVEKSRPDVMYDESYEYDENGAFIVFDANEPDYTDRTIEGKPEMPQSGEISRFGMLWLENEYGEEFGQALEKFLNEGYGHTDEYGMEWKYAGGLELPEEKRYLISRSENEVQLGIRFFDRKAYGEFLKSSSAGVPGEAFFIVNMIFDGTDWQVGNADKPLTRYTIASYPPASQYGESLEVLACEYIEPRYITDENEFGHAELLAGLRAKAFTENADKIEETNEAGEYDRETHSPVVSPDDIGFVSACSYDFDDDGDEENTVILRYSNYWIEDCLMYYVDGDEIIQLHNSVSVTDRASLMKFGEYRFIVAPRSWITGVNYNILRVDGKSTPKPVKNIYYWNIENGGKYLTIKHERGYMTPTYILVCTPDGELRELGYEKIPTDELLEIAGSDPDMRSALYNSDLYSDGEMEINEVYTCGWRYFYVSGTSVLKMLLLDREKVEPRAIPEIEYKEELVYGVNVDKLNVVG